MMSVPADLSQTLLCAFCVRCHQVRSIYYHLDRLSQDTAAPVPRCSVPKARPSGPQTGCQSTAPLMQHPPEGLIEMSSASEQDSTGTR